MKKFIKSIVLIMMSVVMLLSFTACAGTSALKKEIEELKQQISELQETGIGDKGPTGDKGPVGDPAELNVFWTDKYEYTEDETVTVHYRDMALYSVKKRSHDYGTGGSGGIALVGIRVMCLYLPSISISSVLQNICLRWDEGLIYNNLTYSGTCYQNIAKDDGVMFSPFNTVYASATFFDLIICVPGTYFPLAVIKNITIEQTS